MCHFISCSYCDYIYPLTSRLLFQTLAVMCSAFSLKISIFFVLILLMTVSVVNSQRFIDVMMARNEELNGLLGNSRRFANTNSQMGKRNSLLDNLYNIGYLPY
uniref:Uncharacterized protein n=2 Tax=Caenorhabditis japonica TaxID=281687 RepID=A0A8R1E6F1_CAEJA